MIAVKKIAHLLGKRNNRWLILAMSIVLCLSSCYSFKDVSIDPRIKTARINYIDNKARYVNPQLSPQLTEKVRQKINNQTKLTVVQSDGADYDISGYVSDYSVTTSGVANQQAASNRLSVTVHIIVRNRIEDEKSFEADASYSLDFPATLSLAEAEQKYNSDIIQNLGDAIFNRIFSNW